MKLPIWPFYPMMLLFAPKKAVLRNLLFIVTPLLLMSPSCDDDVSVSQEECIEIPVAEQICDPSVEARKTVDIYENERGEIRILKFITGSQLAIAPERISPHMSMSVIQVCNFPVPDTLQYFSDGDKIVFSGLMKEVSPLENIYGNPIILTCVQMREKKSAQD